MIGTLQIPDARAYLRAVAVLNSTEPTLDNFDKLLHLRQVVQAFAANVQATTARALAE